MRTVLTSAVSKTAFGSLCLLLCAQSGAQEAPKRKPGLWQQTVTHAGTPGLPPQSMRMCTDEKTDSLIAAQAGTNQRCTQQSVRREGKTFVVDAVCKDGSTTVRTRGKFSGDFSASYSGELHTTFDPPMHGMKEMTQRIDARWVGPCASGQKPGDVEMQGRAGMNMHELMKADPQKMKEMMQHLEKMQQQPPR